MARLVVSYARVDRDLVRSIVTLLRAAVGGISEVYWDDDFEPGIPWRLQFKQALQKTDQLFVFWCCHSAASLQVAHEIQCAMQSAVKIVPVMLDRTTLSRTLSDIHGIDLRRATPHGELAAGAPSGNIHGTIDRIGIDDHFKRVDPPTLRLPLQPPEIVRDAVVQAFRPYFS